MKHKDKVKLARKMLSREERKAGVPIFHSMQWSQRREARRMKGRRDFIDVSASPKTERLTLWERFKLWFWRLF